MNGYAYMAMTDYPYATAFLNPMPGNPVNIAVAAFDGIMPQEPASDIAAPTQLGDLSARETQLLTALNASTNVYFNYNNQHNCTDFNDVEGTGTLDGAGWNVLACNQLAMPMGNGNNSMFKESTFDYAAYTGKNFIEA
jgi:lysosomal Pro-X carboxypeptidase